MAGKGLVGAVILCLLPIICLSARPTLLRNSADAHAVKSTTSKQAFSDSNTDGELKRPNDANLRPIIGVLSQPGEPAPEGQSYIAASYVKWLEAAGARVVPIMYDMTKEQVERRFALINGLLLPGGGATLAPGHPFYDTARRLVRMALAANDNGDYFPVHGTCLGMETLAVILSANTTILGSFEAEDAPAPLLYTEEAAGSRMLRALPADVVADLQNSAIAMENHGAGLSMEALLENPPLARFFRVLSLSLDKAGAAYISTMEGRAYPFTATQWHPEKNAFEWTPHLHIPHTASAIRMSQEVANYFVTEARRNMHRTPSQLEEDALLIYNYPPAFTGKHAYEGQEKDFEQSYFFDATDPRDL